MITLLALGLVTCATLTLLYGRLLGPLIGPAIEATSRLHPAATALWLRLIAVAPLALGLITSLLVVAVGSGALGHPHHCVAHEDAHLHLCLLHTPELGFRGWLLLMLPLAWLVGQAGRAARRRLRAHRLTRTLLSNASPDPRGFVVPETEAPLAMTVGVLRPTILISLGLSRTLSDAELGVVLAHERAHVSRRDLIWHKAVVTAICAWPSPVHTPLRRAHTLACERACDEAAAEEIGGRLRVAQVLLRIARLIEFCPSHIAALGPAFSEAEVVTRVEALLAPVSSRRASSRRAVVAGLTLMCALVAVSDPVHHAIESIFGFFLM